MTLHVGYIERMRDLAYEVAIDLIKIEPRHREHINDAELKDLNTSMIDIGHRASASYKGLCTWEASIARANLELQTATKAIHEEEDHRHMEATQMAKCDHANITMDCNYLENEVTKYENYLTAEDQVITSLPQSQATTGRHILLIFTLYIFLEKSLNLPLLYNKSNLSCQMLNMAMIHN